MTCTICFVVPSSISCPNHASQGVAVQEWVDGQTLDLLLSDQKSSGPMNATIAKCILEQMLVQIIVPLWSLGTVWWDIRDANWCFDSSNLKLHLIDVDSLWAYAKEILITPSDWSRRNRGRETALSRLKQTCWRVLEAQFAHNRSSAMKFHHELWHSSVEPALRELGGQNNHARTQALDAIEQYLIAVFNRI